VATQANGARAKNGKNRRRQRQQLQEQEMPAPTTARTGGAGAIKIRKIVGGAKIVTYGERIYVTFSSVMYFMLDIK
jgi:hypothetical protein